MARTKVAVNRQELEKCIRDAERTGPLQNRSELYRAVGEKLGLTPSVVMLRIDEFSIELKTPKGKKGRQAGAKIRREEKTLRKPRAEKFKQEKYQKSIRAMRNTYGPELQGLVNRIEQGSIMAAVKLNCLQCLGFVKSEIRSCTDISCPFHCFRPYQKGTKSNGKQTSTTN